MFCRHCGKENKDEAKFCNACGNIVTYNDIHDNVKPNKKRINVISIIGVLVILLSLIFFIYLYLDRDVCENIIRNNLVHFDEYIGYGVYSRQEIYDDINSCAASIDSSDDWIVFSLVMFSLGSILFSFGVFRKSRIKKISRLLYFGCSSLLAFIFSLFPLLVNRFSRTDCIRDAQRVLGYCPSELLDNATEQIDVMDFVITILIVLVVCSLALSIVGYLSKGSKDS